MQQHEPMFNVPGAVLGALGALIAVHVVLMLMPSEAAAWWTLALAFIPARMAGYASEIPGGDTATVTSFVTHMLVHADITHLMINSAWLLAFGGAIAQRIDGARFIAFTIVCGIAGAGAFLLLNSGEPIPMVGASGAISGLMGGVFRFLFNADGAGGLWRLRNAPRTIPSMSLRQALTDRRVILSVVVWIAVNFVGMLGLGGLTAGGGIAWEAHIGGFLAGFFTFGLFETRASGAAGPS